MRMLTFGLFEICAQCSALNLNERDCSLATSSLAVTKHDSQYVNGNETYYYYIGERSLYIPKGGL